MGTYMKVVLRDTREENIKKVNSQIIEAGYKPEIYEGITYGPFVTMEQLREDARFMNEDPEGLKQCPHFKRPITPEFLSTNFFWLTLGHFHTKLSGSDRSDIEIFYNLLEVARWVRDNYDMIDIKESNNFWVAFVIKYCP